MTSADLPPVEPLFDARQIAERVEELAREIAAVMPSDLLVVTVLKGGFVFAADLIRALHRAGLNPQVDFMTLASYGAGTESSGTVKVTHDLADDVTDRDVLLTDDILESGRTVAAARELLLSRGARTVRLCTLLEKPGKRKVRCKADFIGFTVPDRFVVGYGLDFAHYFRDLPYIGMIEKV
ncbi:MAG: hypoxanthine phosphoribosyltransferase [Alphaproteobacteria bacterium]